MSSTPAALPANVRTGPALTAFTRMPLRAEIVGQILHDAVERRLADAHHVVARHGLLAAEVRQRDDRALVDENVLRGVADGDQAVGADFHRQVEAVAAGLDRVDLQIVELGVGDGMHEEVDLAVLRRRRRP